MDVHGTERAKFLTAKAFYTLTTVDLRLIVYHFDRLCGADLLALFTALALLAFQNGLCFECELCNLAKQLGSVIE